MMTMADSCLFCISFEINTEKKQVTPLCVGRIHFRIAAVDSFLNDSFNYDVLLSRTTRPARENL